MPPKQRKAVRQKAKTQPHTAAAAAKKRSPKPPPEGQAAQRPCASPASRMASKVAARKASVSKVTPAAAAAKTEPPVQRANSSSSSSHAAARCSSQQSTRASRRQRVEKVAASCGVRRTSPPPIVTAAASAAAPAPDTRPHQRGANVKQPPRSEKEAKDSGITSATEGKWGQTDREDAHDDAVVASSKFAARTSATTHATRPIVAAAINDNENEDRDSDSEDTILFCSGAVFTDATDATRRGDGARQSHCNALPAPTHPPLIASTAATVEQDLVTSPEASPTDPLCLFGRGSGDAGSSSATLDLRRCSTPPPLPRPAEHGIQVRTPEGNSSGGNSRSRQSMESSPGALMANSESKSSGHRWQRQLLASGTPATQFLREEGEREEELQDDGNRHVETSPTQAAVTVTRLFTQPARSISFTPTSAGDSPNSTLVMSRGSEEDGCGEAEAEGLHRQQRQYYQHPPRPLGVSSIATCSDNESQWSGGRATEGPPLPPSSATAATPPPLPSLVPCPSSAGGVQLFHQHFLHNSGGNTDELCRSTSMRSLSTQSSAVKDDRVLPSLQAKAVASAAQSFPPPAGHLRMGGSTSRQRSPASSSYTWLKRTAGGGEVELSRPPTPSSSAAPSPFPAHPPLLPPPQQQQQWSSYACPRLSFTPPSSSQPSRLADTEAMTEAGANAEGGHAPTATTPQRLRLREPPVWHSSQVTQLPKSLSVSPASLRGDGRGGAVKADAASPLTPPLSRTQPAVPSASSAPSTTGEATQKFTQASTNAAGGSQTPLHLVPSGPTAALAAGRPSTQLITKAAATRPVASPGTMWICLDDDDDDDDHDGNEGEGIVAKTETAVLPHNGSGAPLVSGKREIDAKADGEMDAVWALPGHTVAAGASPSPSRSQAEEGMAAGGGQAEQHGRLRSRRPSPSKADSGGAGSWVDQMSFPVLSPAQARRRPPAEKSYPIAEILSPTFRPRRRPSDTSADSALSLGSGSATHQRLSSQPAPHYYINLDDDTEDSDEDADEAPPRRRARGAPALGLTEHSARSESAGVIAAATPAPLALLSASPVTGAGARSQLSLPLIIDDDDDNAPDVDSETDVKKSGDQEVRSEELSLKLPKAEQGVPAEGAGSVAANEGVDGDALLKSPRKPHVKDFIFPNRLDPELRPSSPLYRSIHAYQLQYQQQQQQLAQGKEDEERAARHVAAVSLPREGVGAECHHSPQTEANAVMARDTTDASADSVAAAGHVGNKRGRAKDAKTGAAILAPALPEWGRPADILLRDFFPTKFTKKGFMEAARTVMSPMHFLNAGDFWAAFTSAEFVGEGSFGLVWRCTTVDGDLVAVKSCPIILRNKASIEDSFSTIREIATMRFLNEMQVPYTLPLHSAFFVHGQEALPPLAQEALEWRRQLRRKAEDAALEVEVKLLARGGHRRATRTSADEDAGGALLALDRQVAVQMEQLIAAEGPNERATRARLQSVRLPRFLSITHDDLTQSDATAFLVTELCDGDVEGISRSDGIAKGMVYCVSSALAAMHELGLLHLDLKPSNILFAYEHGPSQQRLQPQQQFGTSSTSVDAVKFYLSDFGNCRLVGPNPMDEVQDSYGTFEYMDLRALRDAVCGRPTDAFSLGATLYELLYGKRLYPKCLNPHCGEGEEEHSRECFVEAASRPVVLPTVEPLASAALSTPAATIGHNAAASGPSLTPLQYLTLALLRQSWAERMTAEECRRYLVQAFHITRTEDVSP
ncbi:hypothetical protein CUR178_07375 [Leishmania enriettii]|uniref:Protein kinase domain-containing protein n=1 Tax=Leishmania enriettii TaxID=5663 RepID=A0A836KQX0_LEIEN|nr:hypothetical protein CUR178_07375 [Leishmania enriettii]